MGRWVGPGLPGRAPGSSVSMLKSSACLVALLVALLQECVSAAPPASHSDCAGLVPLAEVLRGKGAFLSGCESLSETYLGGCWTQNDDTGVVIEESNGCQTCIIQEEAFSAAVFPVVFPLELDPCPSALDYTQYYGEQYGELSVVTAASLTSTSCPDGWLYSEDTGNCYFKSPNTAKATDQVDAVAICEAEGAWVIAIDSEAENNFLLNNLLFIGFFGETYTGMVKEGFGEWTWPAEASTATYDCLTDFSDWLEGAASGCASTYDGGAEGSSCMEIFPYEPKGWNPFSCNVGKHYVCEMPAVAGAGTGSTPGATPTTTATPTAAAALSPTAAPMAKTTAPTVSPKSAVSVSTQAPTAITGVSDPDATVSPTPVEGDDADKGTGDMTPSPSSTSVEGMTPGPIDSFSWEGVNTLSVKMSGDWTSAWYHLYLKEGDTESAVATFATKDGLGTTETDPYDVKDGCYRLEVVASGDPTLPNWDVDGAEPYWSAGVTSGQGLDGTLLTVGAGVCDVDECHASCLSDIFSGSDNADESASGTCDGYSALVAGACGGDVCPEDGDEDFQQNCVRAGCSPDTVCGLDIEGGGDGVGVEYQVEIKALLEGALVTTTTNDGGIGHEEMFEGAVALWLGVDPEDVTVTSVDGVGVEEEEEDVESDSRRRGLQDETQTSYTRYTALVQGNLTSTNATGLQALTAAEGASSDFEGWLRKSGDLWSGTSVTEVEGEVVEVPLIVAGTSGADTEGDDSGGGLSPLLIGGISAGVVVVAAVVLVVLCRLKKADKTNNPKPARRAPRSQGRRRVDYGPGTGNNSGQQRQQDLDDDREDERLQFSGGFGDSSKSKKKGAAVGGAGDSKEGGDEHDDQRVECAASSSSRNALDNAGSDTSESVSIQNSGTRRVMASKQSSKMSFASYDTTETKRPTVRGPSGALHGLGLGRAVSSDQFSDYVRETPRGDGDGREAFSGGGGGGVIPFESGEGTDEAGSRYYTEVSLSSLGSGRRSEGLASRGSTAEERIRELHDREQAKKSSVTLERHIPPCAVSPGTDWDLAAGIAQSPGVPVGRRRAAMARNQSGISQSRSGGGRGKSSMDGAVAVAGAAVPTDRAFRPPVSVSSSWARTSSNLPPEENGSENGNGIHTPSRRPPPEGSSAGARGGNKDFGGFVGDGKVVDGGGIARTSPACFDSDCAGTVFDSADTAAGGVENVSLLPTAGRRRGSQ